MKSSKRSRAKKRKKKIWSCASDLTESEPPLTEWELRERVFLKLAKDKDLLALYSTALEKLILETRLGRVSPVEADETFAKRIKLLDFAEEDLKRNRLVLKRAYLQAYMGENNPMHYERSIGLFRDASKFPNKEKLEKQMELAYSLQFEADLGRSKSYLALGNAKRALEILESMRSRTRNVDERNPKGMNLSLLKEYKEQLKLTYRKLKRYEDADSVF